MQRLVSLFILLPPKEMKGQKVSFFQNFQNATPTDYVTWSCDSCILINLNHF